MMQITVNTPEVGQFTWIVPEEVAHEFQAGHRAACWAHQQSIADEHERLTLESIQAHIEQLLRLLATILVLTASANIIISKTGDLMGMMIDVKLTEAKNELTKTVKNLVQE
jgi:hypothetical protein